MAEQTTIITKGTPPDILEQDIAETRRELSKTLDEIQERLSFRHWKAVTGETIREKVNAAVSRGKELAGRAGESARRFGRAARDSSRLAKNRVLWFVKNNPSAARVIAFEIGVLIVIVSKSVVNRSRRKQLQREPRRTDYAGAKAIPLEEVRQKVERAAPAREEKLRKAA